MSVVGCSLEDSEPEDDFDDPGAEPLDSLTPEINCPNVVDLLACLPFDRSIADQIAGHHLDVVSGEARFASGAVQQALELDAAFLAPFERANDFEVSSATVELWLGPNPGPGFVFDYDQRLSVQVDDEMAVRCVATTLEGDRSASARIDPARWNHVACVFGSERGIELYVDQTLVDHNASATSLMASPSRTAHLGSDSPGGDTPFVGIIDNLRFWQRNMAADDLCLECEHIADPNQ